MFEYQDRLSPNAANIALMLMNFYCDGAGGWSDAERVVDDSGSPVLRHCLLFMGEAISAAWNATPMETRDAMRSKPRAFDFEIVPDIARIGMVDPDLRLIYQAAEAAWAPNRFQRNEKRKTMFNTATKIIELLAARYEAEDAPMTKAEGLALRDRIKELESLCMDRGIDV